MGANQRIHPLKPNTLNSIHIAEALWRDPIFFSGSIDMAKELRYMQNYIEVAPAPLITHQRYSSCPKLETIVEEASTEKFETLPKISPVMFLLPVLFTFLSYSLLCRHVVWGGKFSLHGRERKCIRLV